MDRTAITFIVGTLIAGATVVGMTETCVDDKGLMFFPAEELKLTELESEQVKEVGKICFQTSADYEQLKTEQVNEYVTLKEDQRGGYLLNEGKILDDILTKEIGKQGGEVVLHDVTEETDIFLKIIETLNL